VARRVHEARNLPFATRVDLGLLAAAVRAVSW
jgi:hypothetical protein